MEEGWEGRGFHASSPRQAAIPHSERLAHWRGRDGSPQKNEQDTTDSRGALAGDGCSAECIVEEGWTCAYGSPEQPDDCIPTTCGDGISHRSDASERDKAFGNGKAYHYPWSCAVYKQATGVRQDGEYWLFVSGNPAVSDRCVCFAEQKCRSVDL
eukprot:391585-Rhodomonas_salina.2